MLVLDGNQKNRRDVCLAKDAGSINYSGLPGHIKTGCTASPSFKSRFCRRHSVRSSTVGNSKEEGIHMYKYAQLSSDSCVYYHTCRIQFILYRGCSC